MSELTGDLAALRVLAEMYGLDDVVQKIDNGDIKVKENVRLCSGCTVACTSTNVI